MRRAAPLRYVDTGMVLAEEQVSAMTGLFEVSFHAPLVGDQAVALVITLDSSIRAVSHRCLAAVAGAVFTLVSSCVGRSTTPSGICTGACLQ